MHHPSRCAGGQVGGGRVALIHYFCGTEVLMHHPPGPAGGRRVAQMHQLKGGKAISKREKVGKGGRK